MTIDAKAANPENTTRRGVSLGLLGGLLIAFLLGYAAYGLLRNAIDAAQVSFSTPELISFVLSVVLSGASIFLAIAAISLGKFSEQAMIQRSDESIRLQNEVFQKTTDALQRIESSTGVTEKRIEDIISGRVGDLSQRMAQIVTEKKEVEGSLKPQEIEEMISRALIQALREEGVLARDRSSGMPRRLDDVDWSMRRERQRKTRYDKLHSRFLRAMAAREDVRVVKEGLAVVGSVGDDLFDGIYVSKDGKRVGIIDFSAGHEVASVRKATSGALVELQTGSVERVHIVLYDPVEKFQRMFSDVIAGANAALQKKISLTVCPEDKIEEIAATLPLSSN